MEQGLGQAKIYQDPMEAGDLVYQREEFEFDWKEWGDAKEIRVLTEPGDVEDAEVRIQGLVRTGLAYLSKVTDTNWKIENH